MVSPPSIRFSMAATSTAPTSLVPVAETDYLDEDTPLRGQNYVCLSFVSPEDVLANKEVFVFNKFISTVSSQIDELLTGLATKYPDDAGLVSVIRENHAYLFKQDDMQEQFRFFKEAQGADLDHEFAKQNDFKTSVRGIKVRGVFDSMKEATVRAEVLKRQGDKFDIFVAQVGCWCPWSPSPADIADQKYQETQLNTLMGMRKANMAQCDEIFDKRKDDKIKQSQAQAASAAVDDLVVPLATTTIVEEP